MEMESLLSPESVSLFPLEKISDLEKLFKIECIQRTEPNLAFFSILLGAVEHSLVHLDYSVDEVKEKVELFAGRGQGQIEVGGAAGEDIVPEKPLLVTPVVSSRRRGRGRSSRGGGGASQKKIAVDFKHAKETVVNAKGSKVNGAASVGKTNGNLSEDSEEGSKEGEVRVENGGDGQTSGNKSDKERSNSNQNGTEGQVSQRPRGDFPPLELEEIEALYLKFKNILVSMVDPKEYDVINGEGDNITEGEEKVKETPKELVKKVSDVVWHHLSRSYKADTPHIQSLYTYLLSNKLDSFGVALAVTAGCQMLGLNDVHLAVSEDHAWIVFGSDGQHTAEVTWHGKGIEDKRGQPIRLGDDENSWLYLKGNAVNCTRHMEAAAIVASINFNINSSLNSLEMIKIQQLLLWQLYDAEFLVKYPMALSCLAELEEILPMPNRKPCVKLFTEAVLASRAHYNDMHVYPYTNCAGYFYRQKDYKSALKYWGDSARVIQKYSRSKNDEEIYREFLEISEDYLTSIMKHITVGFSARTIIRDPCSFAHLLRFFDGICMWEESSRASIVHIKWAKPWVTAIGKFDYTIRRQVQVTLSNSEGEEKENSKLHIEKPGNLDDHEKDSGIDEEDEPAVVTLRSDKMQQMKDLLHREKYNPSAMLLILTAQSAASTNSSSTPSNVDARNAGGRPKRERLSQNVETSSETKTDISPPLRAPPRKKTKVGE